MNFSFSSQYHIKHQRDFDKIFKNGKKFRRETIRACSFSNDFSFMRLGIVVSRKFGNAPKRNYFKRLVRESFRTHPKRYAKGIDIIIMPEYGKEIFWAGIREDMTIIMDNCLKFYARNCENKL